MQWKFSSHRAKKNGDEIIRIVAKNSFSPKGWTLDAWKSADGDESRWKIFQNEKEKKTHQAKQFNEHMACAMKL